MGLPEIYISFETAAVSAVKRSSRGVVALAVTDATKGGAASAVYRSLSEVDESKFTAAVLSGRAEQGGGAAPRER